MWSFFLLSGVSFVSRLCSCVSTIVLRSKRWSRWVDVWQYLDTVVDHVGSYLVLYICSGGCFYRAAYVLFLQRSSEYWCVLRLKNSLCLMYCKCNMFFFCKMMYSTRIAAVRDCQLCVGSVSNINCEWSSRCF